MSKLKFLELLELLERLELLELLELLEPLVSLGLFNPSVIGNLPSYCYIILGINAIHA